jgi:hypothetical protein
VEDPAYQDTAGAFDFDGDDGNDLGDTSDIWIDISTPAAVRVQLATGNNLTLATGITWQQLYSAIIEERYSNNDLMPFNGIVTAESVTAGEFSMRRGAELADETSENLLRNGGVRYLTTANAITAEWLNVTGLGELASPSTTTGYYAQSAATNATTTNFVNPGQPNQMIQVFGDSTHGDFDRRDFLAVYARRIGEAGTRYDLLSAQDLTALGPQRYFVLLSTAPDELVTITADTQVDANADGTPDVPPFDGMSITWQDVSEFYTAWANGFAYPAKAVVGSGGRWWYTVAGGTSSGTSTADDSGVTWVAYDGEREINGVWRAFQVITDLNGASYERIRDFHNWANRQSVDIDAGPANRTGRVAETLSRTQGSQVILSRGGFVDDFELADQLLVVPTDVFGVQRPYPPPPSQIQFIGLPSTSATRLLLRNLTAETQQFYTVSGTSITIETNPTDTYEVRADAPGYLASDFVELPGNTPQFRFNLTDITEIYSTGTARFDRIIFNPMTYQAFITDGPALTFADFVRTIEDYLVIESEGVVLGLLFTAHPIPVTIPGRNILRLPYDTVNDAVNPTRLSPDPDNITDPELLFEVEIIDPDGDLDPTYGAFDFSTNPGRIIRVRSQVAIANVTVSGEGALTTDQATQLATATTAASRVAALVENSDGDRFTAKALEQAPSGGGSVDAQDIADALKLAPAAGTPAAGSVYSQLGSIKTDTGTTLPELIGDLPEPLDANATEEAAAAAIAAAELATSAEIDQVKGDGFTEDHSLRRIYRDTLKRPFVEGDS